ncbi:hypothetical protein B0J11DRAFT_504617 [Dendryphion nanum]|uniref:Uncharacterized protein n=1 Tax=Dendryphion nanum TaxID=256645 RepID=A0A9P9DYJ4_9PLEO|nr:hypothetical protein B0J11DRAFT_504617 [Dendryphion nanum]
MSKEIRDTVKMSGLLVGEHDGILETAFTRREKGPMPDIEHIPTFYLSEEKAPTYWREALMGYEGSSSPSILLTIQNPILDSVFEHHFRLFTQPCSTSNATTTIRAAWALIIGQMTNSEDFVFGVAVPGALINQQTPNERTGILPARIKLRQEQKISEYLEEVYQNDIKIELSRNIKLSLVADALPAAQHACKFHTLLTIGPANGGKSLFGEYTTALDR